MTTGGCPTRLRACPAGCFVPVARAVRERFAADNIRSNAGLPVPVVAVGKLGYPDIAERALRNGDADMIMLGRPLLADPEWPNKAYAGRVTDIRPCIGCRKDASTSLSKGAIRSVPSIHAAALNTSCPQTPRSRQRNPKRIA